VSLGPEFSDHIRRTTGRDLATNVANYLKSATAKTKGPIAIYRDDLKLSHEVMLQLFQPIIDEHIRILRAIPAVAECKLAFLVGGFATSDILYHAIQTAFGNLKLVRPDHPGTAVMSGAVMFGLNTKAVAVRRSPRTIGYTVAQPWTTPHEEAKQTKVLYTRKGVPVPYCATMFWSFVTIGQEVPAGWSVKKEVSPIEDGQATMHLQLVSSTSATPVYTTEDTCRAIGKLLCPMPILTGDLNRRVFVTIVFGGTEITVTLLDETSGSTREARIDFLADDPSAVASTPGRRLKAFSMFQRKPKRLAPHVPVGR